MFGSFWNSLKLYSLTAVSLCVTGDLLNNLVIAINGGVMPVKGSTTDCLLINLIRDTSHVCASKASHLLWLTDWIQTQTMVYSPGDVLISAGDLLIYSGLPILLCFFIGYYFSKKS